MPYLRGGQSTNFGNIWEKGTGLAENCGLTPRVQVWECRGQTRFFDITFLATPLAQKNLL